MARKRIYAFFFCFLLIFLTGCWDQIQVEQRGFVIGAAIDTAKKQDNLLFEKKQSPVAITYQFAAPGGMGGGQSQGQTSQQKPFFNLTAEGTNTFEITRDMASKTSRSPFFRHLKLVILSREVAEKPDALANMLDLFLRDHEMRRNTKIMITPKKAKNILDFKPSNETLPVMAIDSITENFIKNSAMLPPLRIGKVHEYLLKEGSFAIPLISMSEMGKPKVRKAAVFHGPARKMAGILNKDETIGLNFIQGNTETGAVTVQLNDQSVTYEIKRMKADVRAKAKNQDSIQFTITIESEGNIVESFLGANLTDPSKVTEIEKAVEKEIKRLVNSSIKKLHKDLQIDALGLGYYVTKSNYPLWQSIKKDWDDGENYFAKSKITVKTDVKIRTSGAVNKTEKQ